MSKQAYWLFKQGGRIFSFLLVAIYYTVYGAIIGVQENFGRDFVCCETRARTMVAYVCQSTS